METTYSDTQKPKTNHWNPNFIGLKSQRWIKHYKQKKHVLIATSERVLHKFFKVEYIMAHGLFDTKSPHIRRQNCIQIDWYICNNPSVYIFAKSLEIEKMYSLYLCTQTSQKRSILFNNCLKINELKYCGWKLGLLRKWSLLWRLAFC